MELLYRSAGVEFPDTLKRKLQDVQAFHEKVVANRKRFLQSEITRLQRAIRENQEQIEARSEERAEYMSILDTYGALEEYTKLQELLNRSQAELESVKLRIDGLRRFEKGKSALRIEKEELHLQALADYDERQSTRERAISIFNDNSEALYNAPGELIVDVQETGYKFNVEIQRSKSAGYQQMKVFCYDLMLAELWAGRKHAPGFLVHDSTIFSDVDERQVANALKLAKRKAEEKNFQYICLLNSDKVPWEELGADLDLREHTRLILTDADPSGSLLGFRF